MLATLSMTAFLLFRVFGFGRCFLVYCPIGRRWLGFIARVFGHYGDYRVVVTRCIIDMDVGMGASRCWDSIVIVGGVKLSSSLERQEYRFWTRAVRLEAVGDL